MAAQRQLWAAAGDRSTFDSRVSATILPMQTMQRSPNLALVTSGTQQCAQLSMISFNATCKRHA
jgi:hypothetical protein